MNSTIEQFIAYLERKTGGKHVKTHAYYNEAGAVAFYVARFDLPGPGKRGKPNKVFRPFRPVAGGFEIGDPQGPLPIYRRHLIARKKRVYVVEGEKAADAAAEIGLNVTTSAHGADSAGKTDFSPLAGESVVILPDNDQAGRSYANAVARILVALDPPAKVSIAALPGLPEGGDIADFIERLRAEGKADEAIAELTHWHGDRGEGFVGLSEGGGSAGKRRTKATPPYVPFPVEAVPEPLRSFILACAASIGCEPAFIAVPLLVACASAIGNTRRIRLKHGWCELPILWAMIVSPSGTKKSPAFEAALRAVHQLQQRAISKFKEEMQRFRREMAAYKKAANKDAGPTKVPPTRPQKPVLLRLLVSDTTVEALAVVLSGQPRGVLLARDELSGWIRGFNQYKSGKGGDTAQWLEFHIGGAVLVDRKSGDKTFISVARASVCIVGGIQPAVLADALGMEHFVNGLTARFLLAYPPRTRKVWSEDEIPQWQFERITELMTSLYALEPVSTGGGQMSPLDLDLDLKAKAAWIKFYNEHAAEQECLTGHLLAAWSKLEAYAARLALVHHCVREAAGDASVGALIDAEDIAFGVRLVRWFGRETKRIYGALARDPEEQEIIELHQVVIGLGGRVSVRDWHNKRTLATSAEAEAELAELVEAGMGSWEYEPIKPQGGRPRKLFVAKELAADEVDEEEASSPPRSEEHGSTAPPTHSDTDKTPSSASPVEVSASDDDSEAVP